MREFKDLKIAVAGTGLWTSLLCSGKSRKRFIRKRLIWEVYSERNLFRR